MKSAAQTIYTADNGEIDRYTQWFTAQAIDYLYCSLPRVSGTISMSAVRARSRASRRIQPGSGRCRAKRTSGLYQLIR
jgi:hypothetical protein